MYEYLTVSILNNYCMYLELSLINRNSICMMYYCHFLYGSIILFLDDVRLLNVNVEFLINRLFFLSAAEA